MDTERAQKRLARFATLRSAGRITGAETPEELILRAHLDGGDRDELIEKLSSYPYTFPEYPPYPLDGRKMGTWDQVILAFYTGYITKTELGEIRAAVNPPSE